MNIKQNFIVEQNRQVAAKSRLIKLKGDLSALTAPGQFVNIEIPGKYLRRPISVHQFFKKEGELQLLYDVVGEGTRYLSNVRPGDELNLLVGLGNGFSIPEEISHPVLLGGGIGCAPLYQLAFNLVENGKKPVIVLGFNTKDDVITDLSDIRIEGVPVYYATVDGTFGTKGFVTDVIREKNLQFDYFYACGPTPMLKAVSALPVSGELSLESRMGCGFGACMCCSLETVNGAKRICKDGPVFKKEDLIWK